MINLMTMLTLKNFLNIFLINCLNILFNMQIFCFQFFSTKSNICEIEIVWNIKLIYIFFNLKLLLWKLIFFIRLYGFLLTGISSLGLTMMLKISFCTWWCWWMLSWKKGQVYICCTIFGIIMCLGMDLCLWQIFIKTFLF